MPNQSVNQCGLKGTSVTTVVSNMKWRAVSSPTSSDTTSAAAPQPLLWLQLKAAEKGKVFTEGMVNNSSESDNRIGRVLKNSNEVLLTQMKTRHTYGAKGDTCYAYYPRSIQYGLLSCCIHCVVLSYRLGITKLKPEKTV